VKPRLTVRARLTLLYTALFAACGSVVITITYLLVAAVPMADANSIHVDNAAAFLELCRPTIGENIPDPQTARKCQAAFTEGVIMGQKGQRTNTLSNLLQYSILTLVLVTALAALIGWIVASRAMRPVHQIASAARAAARHDLSARVGLTGPRDELRELADTFDDMLTRLQAAFDSQRRFIANASHELRTPLAVMSTSVDVVLAKSPPSPAELVAMGHEVRAAAGHAERLIDALLTLARNEHGLKTRAEVDLDVMIEDAADAVDAGDRQIHKSLQPAVVVGDPVLLERLVANLLDNALRYNVSGGSVWLALSCMDGLAQLTVGNTGPGVPPDDVEGLFEPFRRLNERNGSGHGLGLAIVRSTAAIHGGGVRAAARDGGGLSVVVTLPCAPAPAGRQ
jgi:signal transduction histidine kinase